MTDRADLPDGTSSNAGRPGDGGLEDAIVGYLSRRYPGAVDTRAVWLWAGGHEAQIDYDLDPRQRWQELWDLRNSSSAASGIAIAREALFDEPGHESFIAFLEDSVSDLEPPGGVVGGMLANLLLNAGPDIEPGLLCAILEALPGESGADIDFASLAPAMNHRLEEAARRRLEQVLDELLHPEPAADEAAESTRERGRERPGAAGEPPRDEALGQKNPADDKTAQTPSTGSSRQVCSADDLEKAVSISLDELAARFGRSELFRDDDRRSQFQAVTDDLRSAVHEAAKAEAAPRRDGGDQGPERSSEGEMAEALDRLEANVDSCSELVVLTAAIARQIRCLVLVKTGQSLPESASAARTLAHTLWATCPEENDSEPPVS